MVFSKDMKSPTATSLSTASTEAEELEQEDESPGQPGLSELFASHASASPSSPSSPTHNNAWEVELETQLLAEMRRVTQGYTLLPARPAMTALQAMLKDDASKLPHTEEIKKIVTLLEQLIAELERFHSSDKNPTVNQREAQRSIAQLVTRVPAGLIAAMQVSQEGDPLTPDASQHEIYWAVEKANAAQEEVHALGKAFKKMNESHRNALMSGEEPLLSSVLILATALGAALRQLEDRLIADQNAYSTKAQRKTWTDMRDALKDQLVLHPESVEARMSSIARLHDALASGNTPPTEGYRSLSTLVGHILNTRVQNPRELHAISMLATLALDVGTIFQHTVTGGVKSDIDGAQETATAPAIKQALDVVIEDIDTVRLFLSGGVREGAIKNTPLFNAWDLLPTLKGNLSSINVKVTQQTAFYESEQRRVSLETLRETLTSTAKVDPKTSGEWGIDKLILVAEALLSLEGEKDRRHDAALGNLAERLDKTANGVLSARAMMSAVPREDDNTMPVTAKMLEYAEKHAQKGAAQAQALVISRSSQSRGLVVPLLMRDNFKAAAGGLQTARSHLSSETYRQKMTRKLQHEGRDVGHIANKVVSTVSHTQLKHDKWKAATLPWVGSHAKPVAAGIQRHLRACLYPVIEALTLLKMTAYLEQESLTFKRQYGSTGRSKDRRYDDGSRERYRQASVKTGQAFPWVQEKIAVFVSTLPALGEQPLDAGTTAAVQEFMAGVIPQLAHVDRLSTDWDAARKQQSKEGMSKVIWKIGNIKSAIKKAAELSVGAPQSIYADENKRVRYVGDFLAAKKAKHLAEHPQEGARFDKKVTALLQQHAAELAPAKYGDMAHLLQDAYIAADNNMQLQLPTTEDVVKGMPGFWTKLAGSGPQSLLRRTGRMAVSGTVEMLFILSGAKVVGSIALKSLMFAFSLYKVDSALELARKPWEAADVTTAARWAVMDTLFRQFLFRITKSVLPLGALKVLLPVGQSVYLLTRGDGTALLSGKFTVRKVAEEAVWEGGSQGVSLAGNALGKGHDKSDAVAASENGEIVQGGVSQNNTAAFPGTDAHNTQEDSAENKEDKPKTRDKRSIKPHQAESSQESISSLRSDKDIKKDIQKTSNTLKQLNQPILNPQQRIQERIAAMINQYNAGKPKKRWLTPDTPVKVTVTSKEKIFGSGRGGIVKLAQNVPPNHRVTFALKDVMSGQYKYELDRLTGHKLSDYAIVIQKDERITEQVREFINSVDRNALQSSLQDETDQYFDNPDNAKGFSKVMEGLVKMRVLVYLDEHGDGNEFSQHLSDFYAGKIPAHDLYIDGVRVPGVFSFKIGEGVGSKTLVLNIYTNESFIFKTKNISGRHLIPGMTGAPRRENFPVEDMMPPSAWGGFNKMVQRALPLYEQRKYTDKKNPFSYEIRHWGAPRTFIKFKSGSYMDDMSTQVIKDIKNKIKQDYDTLIYSNKEQMFDYGMLLLNKVITPVSLGAGMAAGPLGILLALGIDATYVAAKFTQAQMSDNPTESDEIKSEAILESVFLGTGLIGETASVALKSYRGLKLQLRKISKTMSESSNTKPSTLPLGKVEAPSTVGLKEKPAGPLPAVTETLPSSKSPVIEIANEFTERAIKSRMPDIVRTRINKGKVTSSTRPSVPRDESIDAAFSEYADAHGTKLADSMAPPVDRPLSHKVLLTREGNKTIVKRTYNDVTIISPENSQATTLVVNAHGGYHPNVKNPYNMIYLNERFIPKRTPPPSSSITVPDDITVGFMGPHKHKIYSTGSPKQEFNNAIKVGPFATVNNKAGAQIHTNSDSKSMAKAISKNPDKAATGSSNQNEKGTLVRDYIYTKYEPKGYDIKKSGESYNRQLAEFVMDSHHESKLKNMPGDAVDILVINDEKQVTLESILKTVKENPDYKNYNRVVFVACRAPSTGGTGKYVYFGALDNDIGMGATKATGLVQNVNLIYKRDYNSGGFKLEEIIPVNEGQPTEAGSNGGVGENYLSKNKDVANNTDIDSDTIIDDMMGVDVNISNIVKKPKGRSGDALQPVADYIQGDGFSNVRYRRVDISVSDSNGSTIKMRSFVVVGVKNGKDYVFDLAAGQYYNTVSNELECPLILPHNEWISVYKNAKGINKTIKVTYVDYNTATEAIIDE